MVLSLIKFSTGDIEDFPGLDGVPHYECEVIAGGGIKVKAYKNQLKSNKNFRLDCMLPRDVKVTTTYVIIGAGKWTIFLLQVYCLTLIH